MENGTNSEFHLHGEEEYREFTCPRCGVQSWLADEGKTDCPECGWVGDVYFFSPNKIQNVSQPTDADGTDAVCVHHPTKKAVAICAGSGDYICPLCAIEIKGETYGAAYLGAAGRKLLDGNYEKYLERPDRELNLLFLLSLLMLFVAPIILPFAIHRLFKMARLRKEDPVYRQVVGSGNVVAGAMLTILLGIASIAMLFAMLSPMI